jgi:hypothetical protein
MVAPADQPRRVLHFQAALVRDGDEFTARCLELGWLCAAGRDLEEALERLRDLVEMELSIALARSRYTPSSCPRPASTAGAATTRTSLGAQRWQTSARSQATRTRSLSQPPIRPW